MHGGLVTFEEALDAVLARVQPLGDERVPLAEAAGRVVAEDARSEVDLPPFPSSAMDGFAVRASDLPARLAVVASAAAGHPTTRAVGEREAVAIATGGAVPDGADAVVPVEYVVQDDNQIEIGDAVSPGAHVRPRGSDVRTGDVVVSAGDRLSPARIGALAAVGTADVVCARRPRAAVLATGSELRPAGEPLAAGEIYEANTTMLAAALEAAGADVERLPTVADDEGAHRDALARGLEADVLVTSGGVSVGRHDLVREVGAQLGVKEVFWGVAVKPGKPVAFGVHGRTLVFGLPGNPVSSLVGFELFVRPAVLALQGASDPRPSLLPARLAARVRRDRARDQFLRARARTSGDDVVVEPLSGQESHMIGRAAAANALILVPRGEGELEATETVRYLELG